MKLKKVCTAEGIIKREKKQPTELEKVLRNANYN
jgi:hypothetical protein